jgi:hypothetical protein
VFESQYCDANIFEAVFSLVPQADADKSNTQMMSALNFFNIFIFLPLIVVLIQFNFTMQKLFFALAKGLFHTVNIIAIFFIKCNCFCYSKAI